MKKIKTTTKIYDDETGKILAYSESEEDIGDDEFIGCCDGDCENCDDDSFCEDSIEYDPAHNVIVKEIDVNLYDMISKTLSMIALGFSAAAAIRAWKKVR